jgi:hypothetical protein
MRCVEVVDGELDQRPAAATGIPRCTATDRRPGVQTTSLTVREERGLTDEPRVSGARPWTSRARTPANSATVSGTAAARRVFAAVDPNTGTASILRLSGSRSALAWDEEKQRTQGAGHRFARLAAAMAASPEPPAGRPAATACSVRARHLFSTRWSSVGSPRIDPALVADHHEVSVVTPHALTVRSAGVGEGQPGAGRLTERCKSRSPLVSASEPVVSSQSRPAAPAVRRCGVSVVLGCM